MAPNKALQKRIKQGTHDHQKFKAKSLKKPNKSLKGTLNKVIRKKSTEGSNIKESPIKEQKRSPNKSLKKKSTKGLNMKSPIKCLSGTHNKVLKKKSAEGSRIKESPIKEPKQSPNKLLKNKSAKGLKLKSSSGAHNKVLKKKKKSTEGLNLSNADNYEIENDSNDEEVKQTPKLAKVEILETALNEVEPKLKRKGNDNQDPDSKKPKLEEMKKKDRKLVRRSQKNNFELSTKAKKLWEAFRRDDCPKNTQKALCVELHRLIKGKAKELVNAHDTARVMECIMIVAPEEVKTALYDELKDEILVLMKLKYAKHFVMKVLKYGTKAQKSEVIKAMYGNITKLVRHSEAASVIECAYNEYANAQQRAKMTEEFYGASYCVFKDEEIRSLEKILAEEPHKKDTLLASLKENLDSIVEKNVIRHSIVHHVLLEYLTHCSAKDRTEMIENIREAVVQILHTKDGSRIGMRCIWHGTAKDRKIIIKSMKTLVPKICKEEYGHMVLMAIFDSVDDTKLVNNVIVEEMLKSASELAFDPHGRKVLMYLVAPRDKAFCNPDVIKILEEGDSSTTCKKDSNLRQKELLTFVSPQLLSLVADNAEKLLMSTSANILLQLLLRNCLGDPSLAFERIAQVLSKPVEQGEGSLIEKAGIHFILKRLIKNDVQVQENKVRFCDVLLRIVSVESLQSWIHCNRGAFTLLILLETKIPTVVATLKDILMPVVRTLAKKTYLGAKLLLKKMDESF